MARYDPPPQEFEARIEMTTAKAHLIEMTLGGWYWMPKSVLLTDLKDVQPDINGNYEMKVKGWWAEKKTEVTDG